MKPLFESYKSKSVARAGIVNNPEPHWDPIVGMILRSPRQENKVWKVSSSMAFPFGLKSTLEESFLGAVHLCHLAFITESQCSEGHRKLDHLPTVWSCPWRSGWERRQIPTRKGKRLSQMCPGEWGRIGGQVGCLMGVSPHEKKMSGMVSQCFHLHHIKVKGKQSSFI